MVCEPSAGLKLALDQKPAAQYLPGGLLMEFGTVEPSGDGTTKFFFDISARKRLATDAGPITAILEQHLDVYAVVAADSKVVTVGHRYERIRRR